MLGTFGGIAPDSGACTDLPNVSDMSLLLMNVRIGPAGPLRQVRIAADRVVAVLAETGPLPGEETVDCQGGILLPGLWDMHVHSAQWAAARRRVDLSGARSAREAADLMAARPAAPGEVLAGYGFRDALWPDAPDKALLEAVAPGRPLVLIGNDLHTAWFSPAALALIGRGDHPTGVLREQDCYQGLAALPPPPEAVLDRWIAEATSAAAARGVVGMLDFEFADNITGWRRRFAEQRIDVRVIASITRRLLDDAIDRGLRTGQPLTADGRLEVGPVKLFSDGSLNTRTAYCREPYPGTADHGSLEIPPEELVELMTRIHAAGLRPAVHAIGDRATTIVLDAFERVGCGGRIEHAQLVCEADLPRFARPGLVVGVQPAHCPDDRDVADRYWPGRTGRAFAYAALHAAGAVLELGSDAPVAPLDPWDGIASAVTRTDDDRPAWHPEQALPLPVALAAAARGRTGVRPGDVADLVIVEELTDLRNVRVFGTLLAGRWTYGPAA